MQLNSFFKFRVYDQDRDRLKLLADRAGISEAAVLRELIMPTPLTEAYYLKLISEGRDGRCIPAEILSAAVSVLVAEMTDPADFPITLQLEVVRAISRRCFLSDPDLFEVGECEGKLYQKFIRAKSAVPGFHFVEISPDEFVVVGPDDPPAYVSTIKGAVLRLWKKNNESADFLAG